MLDPLTELIQRHLYVGSRHPTGTFAGAWMRRDQPASEHGDGKMLDLYHRAAAAWAGYPTHITVTARSPVTMLRGGRVFDRLLGAAVAARGPEAVASELRVQLAIAMLARGFPPSA